MDETRGRGMLFAAWLTVMSVIAWQEIKVNGRAPEPSKLSGATVAMAMLDLAAPTIGWPVAGVMGLGLAIGLSLLRIAKATPAPGTNPPDAGPPKVGSSLPTPVDPKTGGSLPSPPIGPPFIGPVR